MSIWWDLLRKNRVESILEEELEFKHRFGFTFPSGYALLFSDSDVVVRKTFELSDFLFDQR